MDYEPIMSGIRWLDMTAAMLNKELDGFSTAKQRVKYLEELIQQAKQENKDFSGDVVGYYNLISTNRNILNHDIWRQQYKKWEIEKYDNFIDDDNSPLSKPSDALATLKANYGMNLEVAKRFIRDIKSKYGSIAYWDEDIETILYLSRKDNNTKSFQIVGERIGSQIKMFQNTLNHWRLYASIETEVSMQPQSSTNQQSTIHWKKAKADLVELAIALFEANAASLPDNSSKEEFIRRFAALFGEDIPDPNSHVQGTLKQREPALFLELLKNAYLGKMESLEKRSKARRKAASKK